MGERVGGKQSARFAGKTDVCRFAGDERTETISWQFWFVKCLLSEKDWAGISLLKGLIVA